MLFRNFYAHYNMKGFFKLLTLLTLLACFNGLFYLCSGSDNSLSTWISFACINLSFMLPYLVSATKWQRPDIKSSAILMLAFYCVIELVAGLTLIIVDPQNYLWSLIINTILLTVAIVLLLSFAIASRTIK